MAVPIHISDTHTLSRTSYTQNFFTSSQVPFFFLCRATAPISRGSLFPLSVCACVCMLVWAHDYVYGGQMSTTSVTSPVFFFLRQNLTGMELTNEVRLVGRPGEPTVFTFQVLGL